MSFLLSATNPGAHIVPFFSSVADTFRHFTWVDALDILLLAAILFFLFSFLSNRKAGTLLIGLAVFSLILVVSALVGMTVTYQLFSSVYKAGGLALIIIFQPEIRAALEKIGSGSIGTIISITEKKKHRRLYADVIDNICTAVKDLSETRTGALIVIARSIRMDDILNTGIRINADVNSYLLRNLFFNKAPLHDGAVVIDNARIAAAGCLLPLTRRTDIDSDLGTRHRAAIGISEITDAVTVVVSEETGVISVSCECTLTRGFTPETLRSFLSRKILFSREETTERT